MKPAILVAVLFSITFASCYNKNEEQLFPDNFCDTLNVTYSEKIAPIMNMNCTSCHSGAGASGNPQVFLDNYSGVKKVAADGRLYKALQGTTVQMPPPGKLSDCNIKQVQAWIMLGSLNN